MLTAPDPDRPEALSTRLISALAACAPQAGAYTGLWPGLTVYRHIAPKGPTAHDVPGLGIGIVAQGRKAVTVDGTRYRYDQFQYLVIGGQRQIRSEVVEATPDQPCLCLVLRLEPATLRAMAATMTPWRASSAQARQDGVGTCFVAGLDHELASAVVRFLCALPDRADRRVLAPLYLREVIYRVLQGAQAARVLRLAAHEDAANPVAAALAYIKANLAQRLTVDELAEQSNLSASAFTRKFRDTTGHSPYQFVKELRLVTARQLLSAEPHSVSRVAAAVGYATTSHFIKEFRGRFGVTPLTYVNAGSALDEVAP
ncbi:hypothetical protein B1R94_05810 [Mycolicibacterium litorale]|nr:hypothetical protein B1R94_05810 [Mycolicibacterium litorale]